jgi:predicted anti-sigma-YlaC factor YlaD
MSHVAPRGRRTGGGFRAVDLRNLPIVLVLALGATGIGYSAAVPRHWLRGVLLLAVACGVAALCRLLLPSRQAGLLAVRGRVVDVLCYGGLAVAIVALGLALPA